MRLCLLCVFERLPVIIFYLLTICKLLAGEVIMNFLVNSSCWMQGFVAFHVGFQACLTSYDDETQNLNPKLCGLTVLCTAACSMQALGGMFARGNKQVCRGKKALSAHVAHAFQEHLVKQKRKLSLGTPSTCSRARTEDQ